MTITQNVKERRVRAPSRNRLRSYSIHVQTTLAAAHYTPATLSVATVTLIGLCLNTVLDTDYA